MACDSAARAVLRPGQPVRQLRQPRLLHRAQAGKLFELRAQCLRLAATAGVTSATIMPARAVPTGPSGWSNSSGPGADWIDCKTPNKPRKPVSLDLEHRQDRTFPERRLPHTFAKGQ
jgi:hypothetical protein